MTSSLSAVGMCIGKQRRDLETAWGATELTRLDAPRSINPRIDSFESRLLLNICVNLQTDHAAQIEQVTSANTSYPNQRHVAAGAAQDCTHPVPVKQQFADGLDCAATRAGRSGCRHLKSENFIEQSARRVAIQSQIVIIHNSQPPVGPKRSVLIRPGP